MEGPIALQESVSPDVPVQPLSARVRHLLKVARAEFVATGFDAVSIDSIARASGVSKETIYRYYPDKKALFRAAIEQMGVEFSARTTALSRAQDAPDKALASHALAILDSAVDGGLLNAAWAAISIARIMPDFAEDLLDLQSASLEPLRNLLQAIADAQGIHGAVPLDLAVDFGSLSSESPALLMGFVKPDPARREVIAHRVAGMFGQGILHFSDCGSAQVMPVHVPLPVGDTPAAHIRNLLDVAAHHFLESGYQGASLDVIGAEAAVGRGTLYRHFGNKAGLFSATMRDLARATADVAPPPLPAGQAVQPALTAFLDGSLQALGNARSIALHRTVIAEMRRDPELARDVYAIMRAPWLNRLTGWLDSLAAAHAIQLHDHAWYARQMLVLSLKGNRIIAAGKPMGRAEIGEAATHAAAIALHGFTAAL